MLTRPSLARDEAAGDLAGATGIKAREKQKKKWRKIETCVLREKYHASNGESEAIRENPCPSTESRERIRIRCRIRRETFETIPAHGADGKERGSRFF